MATLFVENLHESCGSHGVRGMVFQSFDPWSQMSVSENAIEAPVHIPGLSCQQATGRAHHHLDKVGITDSGIGQCAKRSHATVLVGRAAVTHSRVTFGAKETG
ncbi:hypothetical protein [Verminephrobacter eiseniae]|nr:hypothetical protein [Verminephrobacter eiseniae]MCW5283301.1 hypothetical protein [Verminephrobacter eiseniae]MCW5303617.1 hypothetical protein [Verminephrobacter eiseniae]MCW8178182.1 hypothetical protein [Verminephrobacter eiseniae]MCW8188411.1 hypothetical protein [Verminephrobacter eiseniae]